MGQTVLLLLEERQAEDIFALKNPTASAGFEPANMGTKGQYAASRPPKLINVPHVPRKISRQHALFYQGFSCFILSRKADARV
jgi:hypothetical protein